MNRAACLASLVPATLLAGNAPAHDSITLEPTALQLPRRIGPMYADEKPYRYDDSRLGVSYQYRGPGVSLTVYVYDGGVENLADGPDTIPVCYEFESAKHGISNVNYGDVRLVTEQTVRLLPPDDSLRMREAVFEFTRESRPVVSYVWITGIAGHFLKLRFSSDGELRAELPEARRAILEVVGQAIKPHLKAVAAEGTADANATTISLDAGMFSGRSSDASQGFMYTLFLSALADQNPAMLPVCGGEIVPSFETEVGLFRSVFVVEEKGVKSAFGKRIAKVDAAGFLEEFVWTERHRGSWGDTTPEGLALPEYAAWKKKNLKRLKIPPLGNVVVGRPRSLPLEPESAP